MWGTIFENTIQMAGMDSPTGRRLVDWRSKSDPIAQIRYNGHSIELQTVVSCLSVFSAHTNNNRHGSILSEMEWYDALAYRCSVNFSNRLRLLQSPPVTSEISTFPVYQSQPLVSIARFPGHAATGCCQYVIGVKLCPDSGQLSISRTPCYCAMSKRSPLI